jgi:hypothetical protein
MLETGVTALKWFDPMVESNESVAERIFHHPAWPGAALLLPWYPPLTERERPSDLEITPEMMEARVNEWLLSILGARHAYGAGGFPGGVPNSATSSL